MDKNVPQKPIVAEDFDGPPSFLVDVCPACKCMIEQKENPCRHCGQLIWWKEKRKETAQS